MVRICVSGDDMCLCCWIPTKTHVQPLQYYPVVMFHHWVILQRLNMLMSFNQCMIKMITLRGNDTDRKLYFCINASNTQNKTKDICKNLVDESLLATESDINCLWSQVCTVHPRNVYRVCDVLLGISSGVWVTKAPLVNFSVSKIFDLTKVHVTFLESHSYLTGVPAAELRRHLSNINAIFDS